MWGMPVLHPAFTFRQPAMLGPLEAHVQNFVQTCLQGMPDPALVLREPSAARLRWLIATARERHLALSIDVESSPPQVGPKAWALLPDFARLRVVGVGIDIKHSEGGKLYRGVGMSWFHKTMDRECLALYKEMLRDKSLIKLFVNGYAYDIPILKRYGMPVLGPVRDLRDQRRALSSTARLSLMAQATVYLRVSPWKAEATEDDDDKGWIDAAHIKRGRVLRYNALDCVYAAQVDTYHQLEFKHDAKDYPALPRLRAQQHRLAKAGADMARAGFPIDDQERRRLSAELLRIHREQASQFRLLTRGLGKIRINESGGINANDLAALIFREARKPGIKGFDLEIPMSDKCVTDSGKPSVDKDSLLTVMIQDNCPPELKKIIKLAWKVNAPLKALSTYVDSDLVRERTGPDGRVHAGINTCGAETGRWTCSKPNLFNLSEKQEEDSLRGELPNVRSMYVAPPGYKIVQADYNQLELWMMYYVTGDEALGRMLKTGDVHTARVYEWFGIPVGTPIDKQVRKLGKMVGFASQYAAGLETVYMVVLKQDPDAGFENIRDLHALFPQRHTGIAAHWKRSVDFANTHGFNETPIMGRRRYYPEGFPLKPTETSNMAIQGGAADYANSILVGIDERDYKNSLRYRMKKFFPRAWLCMHVYDSFAAIVPDREVKSFTKMLLETMCRPLPMGDKMVSFGAEVKIGQRWSEV